jgi:hypothetical protein
MSIDTNIYVGSYLLVKTQKNIHELMRQILNDEDLFRVARISDIPGQIIVPNRTKSQGGSYIKDQGVWDAPIPNFSHEDWVRVTKMFRELNIDYYSKSGVVMWYS